MRINYIDKDDITKQEFEAYVLVQMSGQYNMIMDARDAMDDAGLDQDTYFSIIKNYGYLKNKFGGSMQLEEAKKILNKNGYLLEDINDVINYNAYGNANRYGNLNTELKDIKQHSDFYFKNSNKYGFNSFFKNYVRNMYDITVDDNDTTLRFKDKNKLNEFLDFITENIPDLNKDDFSIGRVKCNSGWYFSYISRKLFEAGLLKKQYEEYCHRDDRRSFDDVKREVNNLNDIKTSRKNIRQRLSSMCNKLADIVQMKIRRNCEVDYQVNPDGYVDFSVFPNNGFNRSSYKGIEKALQNISQKYKLYDLETEEFDNDAATSLINDFARAIGA